jgi:predicted RNA methylase
MVNQVKVNQKLYKIYFPQNKKVDFEKLKMSNVSLYSMDLPEHMTTVIDIIKSHFHGNRKLTITDATANVGGATINFAMNFKKVNSVEITQTHCDYLKHNLKQYNIKNVDVFCNDYLKIKDNLEQEIVYFDPPWGGKDYKKNRTMPLFLGDKNMVEIINDIFNKSNTEMIVLKIPKNYDINSFFYKLNKDKINLYKIYKDLDKKYISYYLLTVLA